MGSGPSFEREGGSFRSQDIITPVDPVVGTGTIPNISYSGSIIRIDPNTGDAWPTNSGVGGDPDIRESSLTVSGIRSE